MSKLCRKNNELILNHTHQEICGGRDGDAVMIQPVSIVGVWIALWKMSLTRIDPMADTIPPCLRTAAAQWTIIHLSTTNGDS